MPNNRDAIRIDFNLSPLFDFCLPNQSDDGVVEPNAYKVDGDNGASEIFCPVTELVRKFAANRLNSEKSAGSFDATRDGPTTKEAAPLRNFIKNSDARLEKVRAALRKVFGDDHAEELEEAIQIAEKIRAQTRAEAINVAVSGVVPAVPQNIRPVERLGQRSVAKVNVDPQFAKLVAVDEGEEQWRV